MVDQSNYTDAIDLSSVIQLLEDLIIELPEDKTDLILFYAPMSNTKITISKILSNTAKIFNIRYRKETNELSRFEHIDPKLRKQIAIKIKEGIEDKGLKCKVEINK